MIPALKTPWLQSYPPGLGTAVRVPNRPLHSLFEEAAERYPARPCVAFLGSTQSYAQVLAQVRRVAAGLQAMGVKKGSRVALCLPNCPYYPVAYFAALMAGATVVNLNPMLTPQELAHLLADSNPRLLITTDLTAVYPKVQAALKGLARKPGVIVAPFLEALPWHARMLFRLLRGHQLAPVAYGGATQPWEALGRHGDTPKAVRFTPGRDAALIQYTGGTTGVPKGAVLTHRNLVANSLQIRLWLGEPDPHGERILGLLPLCHVFAMSAAMNLALVTGGLLILLPLFHLPQFLQTLRRTRPTLLPGVPTLFNALANNPTVQADDLSSLRYAVSGGAPLPEAVRQAFQHRLPPGSRLIEGYGLTEASPVVACAPRHAPAAPGSAGLPLPGTQVQIRHPEHPEKVLPLGQTGEVWLKGPQVMQGYWNLPAETTAVLKNGWLRTGDLGRLDAAGYLTLTDRLKDVIISHGYKIYPRQIEDVLQQHPAVAEVSVIAVPHPHKGEAPKAYVSLKPGQTKDTKKIEADLLTYARARLNALACPVAVQVMEKLPRTPIGKVSKKDIIALERKSLKWKE